MKKIGVTWSEELGSIWNNVQTDIDTIEYAILSDLGKIPEKEWTFHLRKVDSYDPGSGSLNMVNPKTVRSSFPKIVDVIGRKKPNLIAVHTGHSCEKMCKALPDNHDVALSPVLSRKDIRERMLESLDYLAGSTEIPVAMENLDFHPGGAYDHVCEADFINEVLDGNKKIWLTLDIAHAEISAVNFSEGDSKNRLGLTLKYLRQLPLDRVIEIHINSPVWNNGSALDMHRPIGQTEENILAELLPYMNKLQVINLECKFDIEVQIAKLKRIIGEN